MKILILGGTGRTGKLLIDEALKRGHEVHALVRSSATLTSDRPGLTLFTGTPYNLTDVQKAMQGCQAILNALNISRQSEFPWSRIISPQDFLSVSLRNVITCMRQEGISRVIIISAWGVGESRAEIPSWFRWFVDNSSIKYPYMDHEEQERLLKESNLNWTIIRPSGLTNVMNGREVLISFRGEPRPRLSISRKKVASFMMDVLDKNLYIKQMPTISEK